MAGKRCGSSKQKYTGIYSRCSPSQWVESSDDQENPISPTCPLYFLIIYASDASAIAMLPDDHHGNSKLAETQFQSFLQNRQSSISPLLFLYGASIKIKVRSFFNVVQVKFCYR